MDSNTLFTALVSMGAMAYLRWVRIDDLKLLALIVVLTLSASGLGYTASQVSDGDFAQMIAGIGTFITSMTILVLLSLDSDHRAHNPTQALMICVAIAVTLGFACYVSILTCNPNGFSWLDAMKALSATLLSGFAIGAFCSQFWARLYIELWHQKIITFRRELGLAGVVVFGTLGTLLYNGYFWATAAVLALCVIVGGGAACARVRPRGEGW